MLAVRDSLRARNQSAVWVEGHSGEENNETADHFAKTATQLPHPPAAKSTGPWDLVVLGERVLPRTRYGPEVRRGLTNRRGSTHCPLCPFVGTV